MIVERPCKIVCEGPACFFADSTLIANLGMESDQFIKARAEMRKGGSIRKIAERFNGEALNLAKLIVAANKGTDPKQYATWLAGDPVFGWQFAGFDSDGVPTLAEKDITLDKDGEIIPAEIQYIRAMPRSIMQFLMGISGDIQAALQRDSSIGRVGLGRSPVTVAESLVQIEIDAFKGNKSPPVAPPITSVLLTSDGAKRISIGNCKQ